MRLTMMNDLHLHHKPPMNRKDNYPDKCLGKLQQLCEHAASTDGLLLGGDIFHVATPPTWFVNKTIDVLSKCSRPIWAIAGNHDEIGGSPARIEDTALWNLHLAKALELCRGNRIFDGEVNIVFASFGEEPRRPVPGCFNILVCHVPVFESVIPFYMESQAHTRKSIKQLYPDFDHYLCGDIHQGFYRDSVLVTGSMMRMTIAQKDYKPRFYEIDTITGVVTPHYFEIEEDVWKDIIEVADDDTYKAELRELVEEMSSRDERLDYAATCRQLAADRPEYAKDLQTLINQYEETKQ